MCEGNMLILQDTLLSKPFTLSSSNSAYKKRKTKVQQQLAPTESQGRMKRTADEAADSLPSDEQATSTRSSRKRSKLSHNSVLPVGAAETDGIVSIGHAKTGLESIAGRRVRVKFVEESTFDLTWQT